MSIVRQWARRPVFVHGAVLSTSISTSTNTTASKPHPTWQSILCLPHSRSPVPTPHHLPRAPHQYHDRVLLEKALQTGWCTREVAGIDPTTTDTTTTTTPPAAVAAITPTTDLWSGYDSPLFSNYPCTSFPLFLLLHSQASPCPRSRPSTLHGTVESTHRWPSFCVIRKAHLAQRGTVLGCIIVTNPPLSSALRIISLYRITTTFTWTYPSFPLSFETTITSQVFPKCRADKS